MTVQEKGVLIIAYKVSRGKPRYLTLHRTKNWEGWELPKGHLEKNDYEETVKIELKEEAGISNEQIKAIEDKDQTVSWSYSREDKEFRKEYKVFEVELGDSAYVDTSNNPDNEHDQGFFFSFDDTVSLLEYKNQIELIKDHKAQFH